METSEILGRIYDGKRKNIRVYPQHVVRASEVGHPCERYLVHSITNWQDKKAHGPELEFIFEGGRAIEELAIKDFEDAGFRVFRPEPDKAVMESRPRISGHIDIRIDFGDGKVITGEIKGLTEYDWEGLNTIEDFYSSRKPWIRKYPAQLMTYLYIKNEERGFFYLKNKKTYLPKLIWMDFNYDYMESILQKTERVEAHVAAGTFPDRINDLDICEHCPFAHICLPDINREGMEFIDNLAIEEMLERRDQLKDDVAEYNHLDKQLKDLFDERERLTCGPFLITGSWVERKGYTVEGGRYIKYKIVRI